MAAQQVKIGDLVFLPEGEYPRSRVNEYLAADYAASMRSGSKFPPIVVAGTVAGKKSNKIVDGAHRVRAAKLTGAATIQADVRSYKSEQDLFRAAIELNNDHGLPLSAQDRIRIVQIGMGMGIAEGEFPKLLRTSLPHVRDIAKRYVTVAQADAAMPSMRMPLKHSVRHLAGQEITADQAEAIRRAPGTRYLLNVNQVLDAIEYDLLPKAEDHPVLWEKLRELHEELAKLFVKA
jgi:hypothetical protein